jgi:hypothetical protein
LPGLIAADPVHVIDNVRDYLAAVSAELGVGLESCSWGSESPAWGYVALDWRLDERDVALVWSELDGWSLATEQASQDTDLVVVAHLDGSLAPPAVVVGQFVGAFQAEIPWGVVAT